jgi:anti-anti-sigma factor
MTLLRQQIPLLSVSSRDHDGVTVVSLWGELDFCGSSALQAYFSDRRRQTSLRNVADLTGLAYIDCACLAVLVRLCQDIRSQGGSFALAGPHGAVHRILAVTGLLTWFDVHDTVDGAAVAVARGDRPVTPGIPSGRDAASLPFIPPDVIGESGGAVGAGTVR